MAPFTWIPVGHVLSDGTAVGRLVSDGPGFQIALARHGTEKILLVDEGTESGAWLAECAGSRTQAGTFLGRPLRILVVGVEAEPVRVADIPKRAGVPLPAEAGVLLRALSAMGTKYPRAKWSEALYLPSVPACLPIVEEEGEERSVLAVRLLTGGVEDVRLTTAEIRRFNPGFSEQEIRSFLENFGATVGVRSAAARRTLPEEPFSLPGRPELEAFFREHVIDQYRFRERYAAMGVAPPNGILLSGPPGSGKSFAARALATYLDWSYFQIGMGEIGSPFIHQTSAKLVEVFREAAEKAPSVVVIDEIDAIAGTRGTGSYDHKIEEISELLKCVEKAAENGITLLGTTNRRHLIDPAFLRKGRFDHIFDLGYPDEAETLAALQALVAARPHVPSLAIAAAAKRLANRPMSDTAWAVNEAARIAVRSSKDAIDDICIFTAINSLK